jgi:hypothetical protein
VSTKRKKNPGRTPHQGRITTPKADVANPPRLQIPRPRVTEYNTVTVVPVFAHGAAGPETGSPGRYDVVFVLGVPGVSSVAVNLNRDDMLTKGDSLLEGAGLQVELETPDGSASNVARIVANTHRRLAQIHLAVTADTFAAAEKEAHDEIMPVLSRLAFEADTPVEVTAVLLTEQSTQIQSMGATIIGSVQPAPELAGLSTEELRPFLAAYREGLNSNSPLYQALSFFKVIEGLTALSTRRARAAPGGSAVVPGPLSKLIPTSPNDLPQITEWARSAFTPYLGKSFAEIKESVTETIRNAVAHLAPGRDVRVADYFDDIRACRDITPILRYMARELIGDELTALPPHPGMPSPDVCTS